MSNYYPQQPQQQGPYAPQGAQNLQFYPTSYAPATGTAQGGYGYGAPAASGPSGPGFASPGFGAAAGVSGRMGDGQGGLRTGWLAAFSTEGYDGEPPLLEELGVNFSLIQAKVCLDMNPVPVG